MTNKTSAETLSSTIEEARNDLHSVAQYIGNTADELIGIQTQIKEAIVNSNAMPHPPPPSPQHDTPRTSYRDILVMESQPIRPTPHRSTPSIINTRANAAIKERQILLDIDPDHPTINGDTPYKEVNNLIQRVLTDLQQPSGPPLQAKAITHLRNGGYIIEMALAEAVAWVRDPIRKLILTENLGGNVQIKDRTYNLLISFVPITTRIEELSTLWDMEIASGIPANSITQMKWIKDPQRQGRNQ